jgi:hypothetical protein
LAYDPQPIAPARRKAVLRAVSDGRRLGVATTALDNAAQAFRSHLGAHWFAPRRMWSLRAGLDGRAFAARLTQAFPDHRLDVDDLPDLLDRAVATPQPDFFTQLLDLQIIPLEHGAHAVAGVFDSFFVDAMRQLRGRFHKYAAAWEVRASVARILDTLQAVAGVDPVFVFVHETPMRLEDLVAKPVAPIPISVPAAVPAPGAVGGGEDVGAGFLSSCAKPLAHLPVDEAALAGASIDYGLMEHQPAGVRHLLARSSALLADDMGLGKTRQAVVACRLAAGERRILVSCPASLRINWEREIHAVFPDDLVGMVGEDRMATLRACRWVIANYERLGGLVREPGLDFAVMAIDEAHYLKEHQAGRTRNAFLLAQRIPRRFLLTGTPILNREIELHTLLRLSGHALGALDLSEFRRQYAGGQQQRQALAEAVSDWMLRRSKTVLKDLGLKTRQVRYVSPTEGLDGYRRLLADTSLLVMPKIVKLRQLLEALKTDFLIEAVQSLGQEDKVIVFCEYMETVAFLKEAFQNIGIGAVSLVGSDNGSSRQRAVDAFQTDPGVRVFIGTTSAAGVGITLTAANYVVFASQPWTPALMRQAEDRAYRHGQRRDVIVIVPIIAGTIDEQILALLESKSDIEADVVESAVRAQLARCPAPAGTPPLPSTTVSRLQDRRLLH